MQFNGYLSVATELHATTVNASLLQTIRTEEDIRNNVMLQQETP